MENNRTALGRFENTLSELLKDGVPLPIRDVRAIGPFDNTAYSGLLMTYEIEEQPDIGRSYQGTDGIAEWVVMPDYDGFHADFMDLGAFLPYRPWSTVFIAATIPSDDDRIARLGMEIAGMGYVWLNGKQIIKPAIPRQCNLDEDCLFIPLRKGENKLFIKAMYDDALPWMMKWKCTGFCSMDDMCTRIGSLLNSHDPMISLTAKYTLAEIYAAYDLLERTRHAADDIQNDANATIWDKLWAESLIARKEATGSFLPTRDVSINYRVVENKHPCGTLWPCVQQTEKELLVLDTSREKPQVEFAFKILQGLVNREKPSLYITHSHIHGSINYREQDLKWLDELRLEGYTTRDIGLGEVWERYARHVKGAVLYDGGIMNEIGDYRSHMLNQTNVLMMIASLEDALPLTPEMNEKYKLPVVFDARDKWQSQFEMMQWAYRELFPRMNQTILATLYPGKFYLMDYLVAFRIFTFWFPERRTVPEENLLNGILASTPPNTPIIGWWFDWMPTPKEEEHKNADALQEMYGLLHGSHFGKILTPSHEAGNLTIHSGVKAIEYCHHVVIAPKYDENKVYYSYMLSDGDNLGEALMLRTRELHWDKKERGAVPIGWSFAPASAVMAPTVLNYYMRTLTKNDLIVAGLGVGYTEPTIYLRAYEDRRTELFEEYGRMTGSSMKPLDTTCLWLINGMDEDVDIYARTADKIEGIFVGYGGGPEMAQARIAPNDVVVFRPATIKHENEERTDSEHIRFMVEDIRAAAERGERFIESWVLNWAFSIEMLMEVSRILGDDFLCVRPDVLAKMRIRAEKARRGL